MIDTTELQTNPQIAPLARPNDVQRGKFLSLTLINWNGFLLEPLI